MGSVSTGRRDACAIHDQEKRRFSIDPVEVRPARVRWRRLVGLAMALLVGLVTLSFTLRLAPGDDLFLPAGCAVAVWWGGAAWLAGARLWRGSGRSLRHLALGWGCGAALLVVSLAAALVVAHVPALREPAESLLGHADGGYFLPVLVLTAVTGAAEELFFRGALYESLPHRNALVLSTLAYTLTTVGTGVVLLVLAAAVLGGLCGWLRRTTGGLVAPIAAHLVWSLGMLLLLPLTLAPGR